MTTTSLHTVTLKTVANYRHAAERAVGAYRVGGHRLLALLGRGFETPVAQRAERLAPRMLTLLRRASVTFNGAALKGIDAISSTGERVIANSNATVVGSIDRVASLADMFDNRLVATSIAATNRLGMPGAQWALTVSKKVAEGADKLYSVAGTAEPVKAAKAATTKVAKTAKAEVAKASRSVKAAAKPVVAEAQAQAKTVTKTVTRRAKAAAKPVVEAVEAVEAAVAPKAKAARKGAAKVSKAASKAVADVAAA